MKNKMQSGYECKDRPEAETKLKLKLSNKWKQSTYQIYDNWCR